MLRDSPVFSAYVIPLSFFCCTSSSPGILHDRSHLCCLLYLKTSLNPCNFSKRLQFLLQSSSSLLRDPRMINLRTTATTSRRNTRENLPSRNFLFLGLAPCISFGNLTNDKHADKVTQTSCLRTNCSTENKFMLEKLFYKKQNN